MLNPYVKNTSNNINISGTVREYTTDSIELLFVQLRNYQDELNKIVKFFQFEHQKLGT